MKKRNISPIGLIVPLALLWLAAAAGLILAIWRGGGEETPF